MIDQVTKSVINRLEGNTTKNCNLISGIKLKLSSNQLLRVD